ncbi:hypothetical protein ACFX11_045681 [Malus domestica]
MKKVHVTLGIPFEYREWRWLLSHLRREKGRLPPQEEIKRIKADAMARPIAMMEPTINEGGKKKHSSSAQETSAEKKLKTARGDSPAPTINEGGKKKHSPPAQETPVEKKLKTVCEDFPVIPKIMIDLTSSKGEKERTARFVPVMPIASKDASLIAKKITQRRSSSMPPVPKFVPKRSSGANSGSPLERLATMKSDKVSMPAKMVPKPASSAAAPNSSTDKKETVRSGKLGESTKAVSGEFAEVCALLKPDLLEDMDTCAKFVDGVREIVGPSLFAKHTSEYRKAALLSMMQKTTLLAAESMFLDQDDTKAAKEMARTMAAEAYSSVEKINKLESELAVLKGSNIPAPTSLQLEAARQEIMDLKTRLDAIQVVDRLEPQVLELQSTLKINDNLKKEIEELQRVRACLLEENEQLKVEKAGFEASLTQSQADFYKLGYVDHLYGRPSDFEFSGKDFETFSISPEDLLAFTFESSFGEVVGEVGVQAGTAEGKAPDDTAAENIKAAKGVTTE